MRRDYDRDGRSGTSQSRPDLPVVTGEAAAFVVVDQAPSARVTSTCRVASVGLGEQRLHVVVHGVPSARHVPFRAMVPDEDHLRIWCKQIIQGRSGASAVQCMNRSRKGFVSGALAALVASGVTSWGAQAVEPAAASASFPTRAATLLPDLVALRAQDLHITRQNGVRKLRFESALANIGDGPVEVRPDQQQTCPDGKHHASQIMYRDVDGNGRYAVKVDTQIARRSAGCMVFHAHHNHWHFEAASRYAIFRPDRPSDAIVAQRKMSFCLRDSKRVPEAYGRFRHAQHYGACSRYSPQGISIGWADVYQSYLAGQAIRLPSSMGNGLYCLRVTVDPKDELAETRNNNNSSLRAFSLSGDQVSYRDSARCRPAG